MRICFILNLNLFKIKLKMNKILNKIALALLFLGMVNLSWAQKADAKSKSLLDAVAKKYKANKNTYFKFGYATGANGKIDKNQTGIFYTTPSQYKLKIMGIEQIFDGNKVYNISDEDQEVTIAKATGSEMMFSPTNYLENYKKDYNAKYVGKKNVGTQTTDLVQLTPIKSSGIKVVNVYLDASKNQLVRVEQIGTNNDTSIISVVDYKINQNLSPDLFKFNKAKYNNYIITEL